MGELALRYPPGSLIVPTGRHQGSEASDPRFPQQIDHVGIRATRLRTLNGLALWTARAGTLVRRTRPGFGWCAELKPAGYPARWLRARYGLPYGVIVHGTELLLLEAKMRRSRFRWWTARQLLGGASVVVANSRWTADLARSVLGALGRPALTPEVRVVPLGTTPSHFRPGIDPRPVRAKYGLDGGPWLLTVSRLDTHKGIDTVIRALPAVRAAFPAAQYAVAGVGSRRPEFERLVATAGLGDAVRVLGFVADADLPALYHAADLYGGAARCEDPLPLGSRRARPATHRRGVSPPPPRPVLIRWVTVTGSLLTTSHEGVRGLAHEVDSKVAPVSDVRRRPVALSTVARC